MGTRYDAEACRLVYAAIIRRWWLDGLKGQDSLAELATILDVTVEFLQSNRPAKFYVRRPEPIEIDDDWPTIW